MFALFAIAYAEDLYVTSNAREGAIFINGVDSGYRTPATVPNVPHGEALVSVEGGCMRGEQVVNVARAATTRVSIVATEQLGTLALVPLPVAARLELDNAPYPGVPGVPLAIECGSHTLRASHEGYVTAVVTVDVGMGQDLQVPLNLLKLGVGSLDLSVTPRSANIFVDGRPVGSDAVSLPSIYQGVHVLSAELDGYLAVKKQIVVEDGSEQAWHFDLVRTSSRKPSTVTKIGGDPEPEAAAEQREVERAAERASSADRERVEAQEREQAARAEAEAEVRTREEARRAEQEALDRAEAEREAAEAARVESERSEAKRAEAKRAVAKRAEADRAEAERAEAERAEADRAEAERVEAERAEAERAEADRVLAAEEAARREAEDRETVDSEPRRPGAAPDTLRVERPSRLGKTLAGASLLAAGVGGGIYGAVIFDQTSLAYTAYRSKIRAATTKDEVSEADDFYDEYVVPRQTALYGSAVGAGLFLAGGVVVLLIDDRIPAPVPVPGGGMLLWTRKF